MVSIPFDEFYKQIIDLITDPQVWLKVLWVCSKIFIYFIVGRIVGSLAARTIKHVLIERKMERSGPVHMDRRRAQTIGKLVQNIVSYTINFIVIMLILSELNVELAPLLAGAGILGLAIGFGAQNLVRDVITGFFIIFEDQFAVGDIIKTGEFQGTVEEIGLRITRIKSWTGEIHIIPNGAITEVTNFSVNNSISVVDVSVAYEADIEKAMEIIQRTAMSVFESNENMVKEPEVLGIQALGASDVVIRVTGECKPMTHFGVARQMRAAMKKALDAEGIEIPYPRLVTFQRTD